MTVILDDLKQFLNTTSTANDQEMSDKLAAAVGMVEGIVGPIAGGSVTETHWDVNSAVVCLKQAPVSAVTSVSVQTYPGSVGTPYLPADVTVSPDGLLRLVSGWRFLGNVTVTYTAGFGTVIPMDLREAILVIGGHLWETQRGAAAPRPARPDYTPPGVAGYALPNRARELLAAYAHGPKVT